ncbi:hypothetical protein GmHk_19G054468 [Glycine max]|nr:hypothetical protein GmHk_19G054468 [Glycine max]
MGSKSTLRLMRTLGPFLGSLAQSTWSLLANALAGPLDPKLVLRDQWSTLILLPARPTGIVARDKVDVTYENWKKVSTTQKDLIWEDIQAEFEIPEVSNSRTKKEVTSDCRGEMEADGVDDTVCEKYGISKEKWAQFCQTRRDPSWEDVRKKAQAIQKQNTGPHVLSRGGYEYLEQKLLAEKTKKKLDEAA